MKWQTENKNSVYNKFNNIGQKGEWKIKKITLQDILNNAKYFF